MISKFRKYRRIKTTEMRPYVEGKSLDVRVRISLIDRESGSPKPGDMIARNPENHDDQWLVASQDFASERWVAHGL